MKEFTIIVPVYNELANIERLSKVLADYLQKASLPTQVLFVDDGSKDGSVEAIRKICAENTDFNYLAFSENRGLSTAIKAGFDYTQTAYVGYIDADLQTTPEDFEKLLPFRKDFAMVTGIRQNRKDSWLKNISRNWLKNYLFSMGIIAFMPLWYTCLMSKSKKCPFGISRVVQVKQNLAYATD